MPISFGAGGKSTPKRKSSQVSLPVTDSLVAYFDANNPNSYPGGGNVWQDLTSRNQSATVNTSITSYSNQYGGHLVVTQDGVNTPAYATLSSALNSNTVTFMAWINPNAVQSAYAGIVIDRSIGNNGTGIQFNSGGATDLAIIWNGTNYAFNTGITVPPNKWSLVSFVVTPTTITPYLNGTAGNVLTGTFSAVSNANPRLGWDNGASRVFRGKFGAAMIYSKSLSAAEVSSMYDFFKTRYIVADTNLKVHLDAGDSASYTGSGSTWTDISGNSKNATLVSHAYSSEGQGSISFVPGASGTISGGTAVVTGNYTKSVWVKFQGSGTEYRNLISGDNNATHAFWAPTNWQNTFYNKVTSGHNGTWTHVSSTTDIGTTNKWHHLCVTFSTTNGMKLYVNGQVESTNSAMITAMNMSGGNLYLNSFNNGGNGFTGQMAQALVYDRELTASEVSQNYNASKGRFYPVSFPGSISELQVWLKADADTFGTSDTLVSGDNLGIRAWGDESINQRNVYNLTSTYQPVLRTGANGLNNLPALSFDGVNDKLVGTWTGYNTSKPYTIFQVVNYTTFGDGIIYAYSLNNTSGAEGDGVRFLNSGGRKLRIFSNEVIDTADLSNALPASGTLLLTFQHSGIAGTTGTFTIRSNGQQIYQNTSVTRPATVVGTSFAVGALTNSDASPAAPFAGKVCEHLYFSKTLNQKEINMVEAYLNAKWNCYTVRHALVNESVFHIDSGDIASYPGSGTTWYDLSSNANNVTLSSVTYSSATQGMVFGSSSMGSAASLANIPVATADRTVISYCKTPTALDQFLKHIVHWGTNSSNQSWGLVANVANLGTHRWGAGNSSVTANLTGSTVYGLAATYKNSNTTETFYKNGSNIGTITGVSLYTGSSQLRIGSRITGPSETWYTNGEIYVVLIFNRCLTDAEIQSIHDYYKVRFGL